MQLPFGLLSLLAAVIPLASAQSSTANPGASASNAPTVTTITTSTTLTGLTTSNGGRVQFTTIQTILITSTISPTQPAAPSNTNSNPGGGSSSSAASSTTTSNLPTGTQSLVTDQAPSPGATGGAYGPDDSFINAAHSLRRNTLLLGLGTVVIGGLLAA